jgi:hypothetical protein
MAANKDLRGEGVLKMSYSTSYTKDVRDTTFLKGEAQNSLTGKNTTKPDTRNMGKSSFGKLGANGSAND